ncbi:hypothetical protein [Yinghuangia soli]|uniref:ATP-binding protein n=1 Tax=Yinghuangia soli TaxID=2908204 RepID=A0AA41Q241_9ACTN|nr:hypothetical protein [Yinghuangia soli]MCF2529792.1 hypothetical protein [Yinghuangia soli]
MGSVARKAAVTAGLGAAIVAGAAAPAVALTGGNAGLLNPTAPALPKVAQNNGGMVGPFPVGQVTDKLPTGQVTSGLGSATQTLPTSQLPTGALPGLPGVPGLGG